MKKEILLKILAWERRYKSGDVYSIVELFQNLIDTGDIQDMDDKYQATASKLIECGLCHRPQLRIVK